MNIEHLDEVLKAIRKLHLLLDRLAVGTREHQEILLLISRAEKQRDELYELNNLGERFVNQVNEYINS